MGEDKVIMRMKEVKRVKVMEELAKGKITQKAAGKQIEVTVRQVRRIVERFRKEGVHGLIHRARGGESNRKYPKKFRRKVLKIYEEEYWDFGPTLAMEKLEERNEIEIGKETLRQWLLEAGLWKRKRKGGKQYRWRERKECMGEMVQADGSHHDWLEGRGPWLVLMSYIDDATNRVYARFYEYEGTGPAMDSFKRYAKRYGLPQSLYMDQHSTYQSPERMRIEDELAGREKRETQFGRALRQLGVKLIAASTPQAKGRVERQFRIFQDRLVKEMRLEGVKSKEEANALLEKYLPKKYNRRFERKAKRDVDLHREVPEGVHLAQVLSIQTKRVLRNDNTIRHNKKFYQIVVRWKGRKPKEVMVEERLNGKLYITHKGCELKSREIQEAPRRKVAGKRKRTKQPRQVYTPPRNHPWRKRCIAKAAQEEKIRRAA